MSVLDTNIWVYSHDTRDPVKQLRAQRLIDEVRPVVLPWQVGCEFVAACRKLEPIGFTQADAWLGLADMQAMAKTILLPVPEVWSETQAIQACAPLSFWDALLIAACLRGGVKTLYTEDFSGTPPINGLSIVNPFAGP
jgi:predicted nucleic acid-binding protein